MVEVKREGNVDAGRWRYQPVFQENAGGKAVSLCEIIVNEDGSLKTWTVDPAMAPMGETLEELTNDLARMLADAYKWRPVKFDSLHAGMTFQKTGVHVENMLWALEAAKWPQ